MTSINNLRNLETSGLDNSSRPKRLNSNSESSSKVNMCVQPIIESSNLTPSKRPLVGDDSGPPKRRRTSKTTFVYSHSSSSNSKTIGLLSFQTVSLPSFQNELLLYLQLKREDIWKLPYNWQDRDQYPQFEGLSIQQANLMCCRDGFKSDVVKELEAHDAVLLSIRHDLSLSAFKNLGYEHKVLLMVRHNLKPDNIKDISEDLADVLYRNPHFSLDNALKLSQWQTKLLFDRDDLDLEFVRNTSDSKARVLCENLDLGPGNSELWLQAKAKPKRI